MEEALLALIRADAAVTTALGTRINWLRRPQEDTDYPAATLQVVNRLPGYHSKGRDGLTQSRVQIDVWAVSYAAAKTAMRAVQNVLSGYSGTNAGVTFQGIFVESERDTPDEEASGNKRLFRITTDLQVWHK